MAPVASTPLSRDYSRLNDGVNDRTITLVSENMDQISIRFFDIQGTQLHQVNRPLLEMFETIKAVEENRILDVVKSLFFLVKNDDALRRDMLSHSGMEQYREGPPLPPDHGLMAESESSSTENSNAWTSQRELEWEGGGD